MALGAEALNRYMVDLVGEEVHKKIQAVQIEQANKHWTNGHHYHCGFQLEKGVAKTAFVVPEETVLGKGLNKFFIISCNQAGENLDISSFEVKGRETYRSQKPVRGFWFSSDVARKLEDFKSIESSSDKAIRHLVEDIPSYILPIKSEVVEAFLPGNEIYGKNFDKNLLTWGGTPDFLIKGHKTKVYVTRGEGLLLEAKLGYNFTPNFTGHYAFVRKK